MYFKRRAPARRNFGKNTMTDFSSAIGRIIPMLTQAAAGWSAGTQSSPVGPWDNQLRLWMKYVMGHQSGKAAASLR